MNKKMLEVKEICTKSFDTLVSKGYSPKYQDDQTSFDCMINGIKFSFYQMAEDMFGFSAEFNLKQELSEAEKDYFGDLYEQTDDQDFLFENLHIDGTLVLLSSAFTIDLYPDDIIESCIKVLERESGIVAQLKAESH